MKTLRVCTDSQSCTDLPALPAQHLNLRDYQFENRSAPPSAIVSSATIRQRAEGNLVPAWSRERGYRGLRQVTLDRGQSHIWWALYPRRRGYDPEGGTSGQGTIVKYSTIAVLKAFKASLYSE